MDKFSRFFDQLMRQIGQLETMHWVGIAVVLLVVGIGCMRGMNTRM